MMGCLEVDAFILIMTELVAVVITFFAEVPPHRLHGNATSRGTSDESEWERARLSA